MLKTVKLNYQTVWNILIKFCRHINIERSSSRNCKMAFIVGRDFAELQILKMALSLKLSGIF